MMSGPLLKVKDSLVHKYAVKLVEDGFDVPDNFVENVALDDLEEAGLKKGHQKRIMTWIEEAEAKMNSSGGGDDQQENIAKNKMEKDGNGDSGRSKQLETTATEQQLMILVLALTRMNNAMRPTVEKILTKFHTKCMDEYTKWECRNPSAPQSEKNTRIVGRIMHKQNYGVGILLMEKLHVIEQRSNFPRSRRTNKKKFQDYRKSLINLMEAPQKRRNCKKEFNSKRELKCRQRCYKRHASS